MRNADVLTRDEIRAKIQQAIKDGKIKPHVETRPLDECGQVIEQMIAGKLKSRVALIP